MDTEKFMFDSLLENENCVGRCLWCVAVDSEGIIRGQALINKLSLKELKTKELEKKLEVQRNYENEIINLYCCEDYEDSQKLSDIYRLTTTYKKQIYIWECANAEMLQIYHKPGSKETAIEVFFRTIGGMKSVEEIFALRENGEE